MSYHGQQTGMPIGYRAFSMDDRGRVASAPAIIDAKDDLTAIREAQALATFQAVELWQGSRLVKRIATIQPC